MGEADCPRIEGIGEVQAGGQAGLTAVLRMADRHSRCAPTCDHLVAVVEDEGVGKPDLLAEFSGIIDCDARAPAEARDADVGPRRRPQDASRSFGIWQTRQTVASQSSATARSSGAATESPLVA